MSKFMTYALEKCTLGYKTQPVLQDVSLKLENSGIYCVFGRNGSGKSTLLKSMAGLLKPLSGQIILGETPLSELNPDQLAKKVSVVLTSRPWIANMTAEGFVRYGRYPYTNWLGIQDEGDIGMVKEALEKCGASDLSDRLIVELSDGEMQKVQIARAVAQQADIMLLDEPITHLDVVNRAEIFRILKNLAAEGKTVIFSSHDLGFSLQLSDYFIVLEDASCMSYDAESFRNQKVYERVLKGEGFKFDALNQSMIYEAE